MKAQTRLQYHEFWETVSYLNGTRDLCLSITFDSQQQTDGNIRIFVDCGEPSLLDNRGRRKTRIVKTDQNSVIGWHSKRQTAATDEIVEGELFAMYSGMKKSLAVRNLL